MAKRRTKIADKSADRKHFIAVPQTALHACHDTFEWMLLNVVAMVYDDFGECVLPVEDLANLAMMSPGKTSECLASLTNRGLLIAAPAISVTDLRPGRDDGCSRCKRPYPLLEKHHIIPLSEGGLDLPENIAYICPNCHRLAHSLKYIPYWRAP